MTPDDKERLIEEVVGAWRPRDKNGGTQAHPGWHDLAPSEREEAARAAEVQRRLEALLDDDGQSTTVKAVLGQLRAAAGSRKP